MLRATGIQAPAPMRAGGILPGYGQQVEEQGAAGLASAAVNESRRDAANEQIRQQNKAGGAAIGSMIGGIVGSVIPGVGTGGII